MIEAVVLAVAEDAAVAIIMKTVVAVSVVAAVAVTDSTIETAITKKEAEEA